MGNPWENPLSKKQSVTNDFEKLFKADFKESYKKAFFNSSHRLTAIEAGYPIKNTDLRKKSFLEKEERDYIKALTGKSKEEFAKEFGNYKMPEFSQVVKKNQQAGKPLSNADNIEKYKWAIAFAPLAKEGVRDFRHAKKFEVTTNPSGRIYFNTDLQSAHEKLSYDSEKLFLSMLAESEDGDREFTIQPYAHTDKENKIISKSLLVLNSEQRKMVREFMIENMKQKL